MDESRYQRIVKLIKLVHIKERAEISRPQRFRMPAQYADKTSGNRTRFKIVPKCWKLLSTNIWFKELIDWWKYIKYYSQSPLNKDLKYKSHQNEMEKSSNWVWVMELFVLHELHICWARDWEEVTKFGHELWFLIFTWRTRFSIK